MRALASARRHRFFALVLVAACALGLSACGGDEAATDKSPDALNFSQASAAKAGLYGVRDEPTTATSGYTSYVSIQDSTGAISFEAPTEWADASLEADPEGSFQSEAAVSPNLDQFVTAWDVPGAYVGISKSLGAEIAAAIIPELVLPNVFAAVSPVDDLLRDCGSPTVYGIRLHGLAAVGVNVFEDALVDLLDTGLAYVYSNCGGRGTQFIDLVGYSKAAASFLYIQLQNVSEADLGATARFLATLQLYYARVPAPSSAQLAPDHVLP